MNTWIVMARALAILLHLSPLSRTHEVLPGWEETPEQRLHRYYSIAADVSVVALEVCKGNVECAKRQVTAGLGVAWHESGFAPDVDLGPCYRGKDGKGQRCDGGNAYSMWQLRPLGCATGPHAPPGPCAEAVAFRDRRVAFREAIKRMGRSQKECARIFAPKDEQLAVYSGGGCKLPMAIVRSRELFGCIRKAASAPDLPKPNALKPASPIPVERAVAPAEMASTK